VEEQFPDRVLFDYGPHSAKTSDEVRQLVHTQPDLPKLGAVLAECHAVLLAGHVEYSRYAQLFPPHRVITFVRDPVQRIVSEWQHVTRHYGFKGTLLEVAARPRRQNVQSRVLRGARPKELGFMGITERYAESLELFCSLSGWRLRELKRNAKPEQEPVPEISEQDLAQLRAWNERDVRLYERANRIFSRLWAKRTPRPVVAAEAPRPRDHQAGGSARAARERGAHQAGGPARPGREQERPQKGKLPRGKRRRHTSRYAKPPLPLVSKEHKLAVLFTPKAGCTFAVKWYFEQVGLLSEALAYHTWIHRYRQFVYYQSAAYNPDHIAEPGVRIVKFVRNPFDRVVSSYVHAVRTAYENDGLTRFLGRELNRQNSFSFREFVDYLGSVSLSDSNQHHRMQYHPLEAEGLIQLDRVVKIEESQSAVPELETALGLKQTDLGRLTTSAHHTKRNSTDEFCGDTRLVLASGSATVPPSRNFYDDVLAARVVELYRKDFDAYGYDTAPPHAVTKA
jgi:hypothetical protein